MGLTGVGARQVVPRVHLFDDVLVDLRPLALCVTPKMHKRCGGREIININPVTDLEL